MIVVRMGLSYFTIFCSSIRLLNDVEISFMIVGNSVFSLVELSIVKDIQNSYFTVMEETNLIYKITGN